MCQLHGNIDEHNCLLYRHKILNHDHFWNEEETEPEKRGDTSEKVSAIFTRENWLRNGPLVIVTRNGLHGHLEVVETSEHLIWCRTLNIPAGARTRDIQIAENGVLPPYNWYSFQEFGKFVEISTCWILQSFCVKITQTFTTNQCSLIKWQPISYRCSLFPNTPRIL